ncbi:MAG TPA: desulforedoxin [Acidimicrobiia bacterium]|nr:desulforedoxin [Acidimicrobiia bacterium]
MGVRVGMRLRCDQCGSEAIITAAGQAELQCCGAPLTVIFEPAPSRAAGGDEG